MEKNGDWPKGKKCWDPVQNGFPWDEMPVIHQKFHFQITNLHERINIFDSHKNLLKETLFPASASYLFLYVWEQLLSLRGFLRKLRLPQPLIRGPPASGSLPADMITGKRLQKLQARRLHWVEGRMEYWFAVQSHRLYKSGGKKFCSPAINLIKECQFEFKV